ncbi:MAG: hypothetical protein QOI91_1727 [Solirubrobacteraceae bacterium]|jgi:uncharacterized membrane protein|nr:hypothetical protein [Solirubrobacteraceae bacterium]
MPGYAGRVAATVVTAGLLIAFGPAGTMAATSPVTLDTRDVIAQKAGGGWTASVGVTNLTDRDLVLAARPARTKAGCDPSPDNRGKLPRARHVTFKVTIPAACQVAGRPFAFDLTATVGRRKTALHVVATLKKPDPAKPDWDALWSFLVALAVALVLVVAVLVHWTPEGDAKRWPNQPLLYLDDTWSFKDSWVSNITVAGGLLAGIFGSSDVLKAILGDKAEGSLALATVGGAVAAAFIAAAGILVLTFKTKADDRFTVGGVLAAVAVALAGAAGQLWVVFEAAREFDLGGLQKNLLPVVILALALLALYGFRSLGTLLHQGTTKPPPVDSDTIVAASMIAKALKPDLEPRAFLQSFATEGLAPDVTPVDRPRARRSALP